MDINLSAFEGWQYLFGLALFIGFFFVIKLTFNRVSKRNSVKAKNDSVAVGGDVHGSINITKKK